MIGGEESAGLSIKRHVSEKEGILTCFLVAEMVARERTPVTWLLERLYSETGRYVTKRENLTLSFDIEDGFGEKMRNLSLQFAGINVKDVITLDGTKCILENGSWLLFRKSGMEPVVRLYCEASTVESLNALVAAGKEFIFSLHPESELVFVSRQGKLHECLSVIDKKLKGNV